MKKNKVNILLVILAIVIAGIGCSQRSGNADGEIREGAKQLPEKLDSYEIKGFKFAYYQIPSGLDREKLIEVAQLIHEEEGDSQLILVDDDSKVAEYIAYVKALSNGTESKPAPEEWADKHIVANVQKYMNGRWVLCESNGSNEIADLK